MTTTIFATHHYNYPQNFIEMKPKLKQLEQAIKKLEANLMNADAKVLDQRLASHLGLQVDYASELNPNQLLAATTIDG
ncbi:MAG: hypothetical protein L0H51_02195 [Psychrobacter sp.]|nr:hypothetical protein [Psychrobacter sp.]